MVSFIKVGNELINAESQALLKIITPGFEKTMNEINIDIINAMLKSATVDDLFLWQKQLWDAIFWTIHNFFNDGFLDVFILPNSNIVTFVSVTKLINTKAVIMNSSSTKFFFCYKIF